MSVKSMMVKKIKAIDYEKLNKLAKEIAERNNKSASYVKRDMIKNFIKYGIGYTDYLKGDYINLTSEQKKTYVTTKSYYKLLSYLNDPKYTQMMNDKIIFNKIFRDYLGRDWIDLRVTSLEDFKKFIEEVILKLDEAGRKKQELDFSWLESLVNKYLCRSFL